MRAPVHTQSIRAAARTHIPPSIVAAVAPRQQQQQPNPVGQTPQRYNAAPFPQPTPQSTSPGQAYRQKQAASKGKKPQKSQQQVRQLIHSYFYF